jgi:ABC-type multidrug transport system fused ATPase/permease subunit
MPSTRDLIAALRVLADNMDRTVAWRLVATVLMVVAGGLLAGLAPLALKVMIDAATGTPDLRDRTASTAMLTSAAAYLVAICGGRLLTELRPSLIGAAEQRLYARLRRRFFGHLLALPLTFHLGRSTGAMVHGLQQAISGYQVIVFNIVHSIVPVLVELVTVALVLASLGQPALIATFVGSALAYLAVMGLPRYGFRDAAQAVSNASIDAHGLLTDGLLNIEAIKCFGAERTARDRFGKAADRLEGRWARLQRHRLRMGFAVTATFALSMSASLAIAVHAVTQGTLTTGGFVLANVYMLQVLRPLEMLGSAARDLSQSLEFIRPLIDVLQEAPEIDGSNKYSTTREPDVDSPGPADTAVTKFDRRGAPSISFRDVHLAYGAGKPVLRGLSLNIAAGSTVAIVGASGSGKSSLVRLLLRLCEPQAGGIVLDGIAIDALPLGDLRSMVAVVPQDTVLFNESIAFNIGIGKAGATQGEIEQAARLAEIHEFIAALPAGYGTMVGERGLRLSGGERQRIAIARAVLKNPRVFVFDEATSMLGSLTERAIVRNLQQISADRTTITIAHRLATVRHADEIVILDEGRVAECGDHAALLASGGAYAAMWHAQQEDGSA